MRTLHEVYCKKAGFSISKRNRMSSCEEFFDRLRKLALAVDKESNELKGLLENSELSTYNENRACLLLRETLAQVKDCEVKVYGSVELIWNKQMKKFVIFHLHPERSQYQT